MFLSYLIKHTGYKTSSTKTTTEKSRSDYNVDNLLFNDDHIRIIPANISSQFSLEWVSVEQDRDRAKFHSYSLETLEQQSNSYYAGDDNKMAPFKTTLFEAKRRTNLNHDHQHKVYLILEYTNVFFQPKFCTKSSEAIFNSGLERCPFQNCVYTCEKSEMNKADALIFHQRDLEAEYELKFNLDFAKWLENTIQLPFKTTEKKLSNNANQIWVLWNDEASHVDEKFNQISQLFNWTLSVYI